MLASLDTVIFDIQDIGAPWLDSKAVIEKAGEQECVILRECSFTPAFSDCKDVFCHGIQLHVTDRELFSPFAVGIRLLDSIRKTHDEFEIEPSIANLLGTDDIFKSDFNAEDFILHQQQKVDEWQALSKNGIFINKKSLMNLLVIHKGFIF